MGGRATPKENAELEAAIVAAPDDPGARMVYGDWLQAQGDPRGEWAAIRARLEAEPDNHALRVAAIEFEGDHKVELFGAGAKAITRGYVGWNGGFADEIRIQPHPSVTAASLVALFAHPTVRFVRHVAIGALPAAQRKAAIGALTAAKLLEELVYQDDEVFADRGPMDAITALPITKLSLSGAWLTQPMPKLQQLTVLHDEDDFDRVVEWIAHGGCKNLTKLTLLEEYIGRAPDHPALRGALAKGAPRAELVRMTGDLFEPTRLNQKNPILELARTGGRAAVRHIPKAGVALYTAGSYHLSAAFKNARDSIPFLDIAATLPNKQYGTWQVSNAAVAHERALDLVGAELRGREALLYSPREGNFFAIVIDALRRTNRHAEALALLPKAKRAMANPPKDEQPKGIEACLLDCMLTLSQVGRHEDAIALAKEFEKRNDSRIHAALTVIHMAANRAARAKRAWAKAASGSGFPIWHHARAVIAVASGDTREARKAIAAAQEAGYGDMHWIASDPALAPFMPVAKKKRPKQR